MKSISSKYSIVLYPKAYRDIEEIYKYIVLEYLEPSVAKNLIGRIWSAIESLADFPYSHQDRLVGKYSNKGYKQLLIDSYMAIYKIDEDSKQVIVITVQFIGRNI